MQAAIHDPRAIGDEAARQHAEHVKRRQRMASAAQPQVKLIAAPVIAPAMPISPKPLPLPKLGNALNPTLTFSTFIEGRTNILARVACQQAATGDIDFSPLVIHGRSGLGKSHLLQAIAAAAPERSIYLHADYFCANVGMAREYIARNSACRLVLIDDIQLLARRGAQGDLLSFLLMLSDMGRQLVVASSEPPIDLEDFDYRVRSRLAGGLVVEIAQHDRVIRAGMLQQMVLTSQARSPQFALPEGAVDYIADHVHGARDLSGVLHKLVATAALDQAEVTMAIVEATVAETGVPQEDRRVRIEDIQRAVARDFNVSRSDMLSARRTANVVWPRQIAMWLAKTMTLRSLPEIGRRFGGRDHTTVLHAVRKIDGLHDKDRDLQNRVISIKHRIWEGK